MVNNIIERNLRQSFSYVRRDLMQANEQINNLHEKVQRADINYVALLDEIRRLESDILLLKGRKAGKAKKPAKAKKSKTGKAKPKKKVVKETITYS